MLPLFTGNVLRVVATDSGLGGIAVAADLARQLATNGVFEQVRIVFFNCRPAETFGFDTMATPERKYRVFSNALDAMAHEFAPDVILIACNTLSVLFDQTEFASRAHTHVMGIVEIGVDMIDRHLQDHPNDNILMFAAPTTVQSDMHRQMIMARGWPAPQLIYQDCGGLPTAIEQDVAGPSTRALVDRYVQEAVKKSAGRKGKQVAALLCTHFGFALRLFQAAFRQQGVTIEPILDPTTRMAAMLLPGAPTGRFKHTEVTVEVVSQTQITAQVQDSISAALERRAPQVAGALRNYTYRPGLFKTD